MNKFRKKSSEIAALVLGLLLLVLPVVGILNAGAAETSGTDSLIRNGVSDGYYYEEYENHICITSYRGSESEITIPSRIGGKPVTQVGGGNRDGFLYVRSVEIPDTVTELGWGVFLGSKYLESVTLPANIKYIPKSAFEECRYLREISIPQGVETIGGSAFSKCENLTDILIPDSVTSIGIQAFYKCENLSQIQIPKSVTEIGYEAFDYTKWLDDQTEDFVIAGDGVLINYRGDEQKVIIPDQVSVIGCAFDGNETVTSVVTGNHVTKLMEKCFYKCSNLEEIILGDSITEIPDDAMYHLERLKHVEMGKDIISIGENAFYSCDSLEQISLPEGLKEIKSGAFNECYTLKDVNIPDSVTKIGRNAFSSTPWYFDLDSEYVIVGNGILVKYNKGEDEVKIPDGVRVIGSQVFGGSCDTTRIEIPDTVEEINSYAFSECDSLTTVTIPDSVKEIGSYAFNECVNLNALKFSDTIEVINEYVFNGCSNLAEVILPDREELAMYIDSFFKRGENGGIYRLRIPEAVRSIAVIDPDTGAEVEPGSTMLNSYYGMKSGIMVCGAAGSYAEEFAKAWNLEFAVENPKEEAEETSVSTFDGKGYHTPEAALTAFVEGMQEQDMEKMMSAFAVEEFVGHMQMDKMVEYWMGYIPQYGYVPDSKFAGQMNVMCRRNEIIDDLRTQYLYLIGSPLADDNIRGPILSDYDGDVQELKEFCFPGNGGTFPEKIVLKGFFDIKKLAAAFFEDEEIKGGIENGIQRNEKAYEGEIEPVSAWLVADGKDYLLCMDMIKYDDCWYGLRLGGTITYIIGIIDTGGLISFEDVSEKGCELDYEGSVYVD